MQAYQEERKQLVRSLKDVVSTGNAQNTAALQQQLQDLQRVVMQVLLKLDAADGQVRLHSAALIETCMLGLLR